jgi:hypothetical protein
MNRDGSAAAFEQRADAKGNADRLWIERGHFSDPRSAWPIQLRLVEMKPRGYSNGDRPRSRLKRLAGCVTAR